MTKPTLTLKQAADAMGISVSTVRVLIQQPGFPAFKVGQRWVIPAAEFVNWLNEQGRAGARY